jgi:diguanylate cyclase (GGDEF)-like protein/PAS domain S-box-containing protein
MLVGFDAVNALGERDRAIQSAWRDTANLARSLAQHAEDTFRAADVSIIGVVQRLQLDGTNPVTLGKLRQIMATRLDMFPALTNQIIVDAGGACIASGRPILAGGCAFANSENLAYHRSHAEDTAHIGPPIKGKGVDDSFIPISRRFNASDGSFAGIVVGTISIARIDEFYGTFDIGQYGAILLALTDGIQLVRRPISGALIGRDLRRSTLFRELLPNAPAGNAEITSVNDGIVRLNSYRTVETFPLVVSVALAKDEVLADWFDDLHQRVIHVGSMIVIVGGLGIWLAVRIRRHQRLEATHRETAAAFRLLAENSSDLIVRLGPDMKRLYVSPASRNLLGYEPEELLGRSTSDIVHPEDRARWEDVFGAASRDNDADIEGIYRVLRKDGSAIWIEVCRRRLASGDGYVVSTRNITRRKLAEDQLAEANQQLNRLARQDGLTGAANRRHFDETLDAEFRRAKRDGSPLSLIMIDVDRFKLFNDRYGHPAGDDCLRKVAGAIKNLPVRAADLVARYGGEELAILLPGTPEAGATILAERARSAVRGLAIPHAGSEARLVTISLGVATLVPQQSGQPDDLVIAADKALYRAKEGGRDRVCVAAATRPKRISA